MNLIKKLVPALVWAGGLLLSNPAQAETCADLWNDCWDNCEDLWGGDDHIWGCRLGCGAYAHPICTDDGDDPATRLDKRWTSDVAVDAGGNTVTVWADDRDGNGAFQIRARGLTSYGSRRFERTANSTSRGQQEAPAVAMDHNGNFVVVWQDDNDGNGLYQIYARGFHRSGSQRFAQKTVNVRGAGNQVAPAIAMDPDGNFVVVWLDDVNDDGEFDIRGRGFHADGSQRFAERTLNPNTAGQQLGAAVAMDDVGNFVVAWQDDQDGNELFQIHARGFHADGTERFGLQTVNTIAAGQQLAPDIAVNPTTGDFVVAWQDDNDNNGTYEIMARGFDADGSEVFPPMIANTTPHYQQLAPAVAMDTSGNFVVVWEDDSNNNGYFEIYGRGFDASGSQVYAQRRINGGSAGQQVAPAVAMDAAGRIVACWQDDRNKDGLFKAYTRGFSNAGTERYAESGPDAYSAPPRDPARPPPPSWRPPEDYL